MSRGTLRETQNLNRKFGSSKVYLFCKVQEQYGEEEYWLLTNNELEEYIDRATTNIEDLKVGLDCGEFSYVSNNWRTETENTYYICAKLVLEGENVDLLLTESDLEGLRYRVSQNEEDIEANKESWLTDLFD